MGILSFTADVNKTVTVEGELFTITIPQIPTGIHIFANEVELYEGDIITLSEDLQLTISVDAVSPSKITVNHTNTQSAKYDNVNVTNGQEITVTSGNHVLDFVGATSIPAITMSGDGITGFTVNGTAFTNNDLPYTFTPMGGTLNTIFMQGQAVNQKRISIAGTDIETLTINNVETPLPYESIINDDMIIAVAGRIYQVDIESKGGAKVVSNGNLVTDGNASAHKIIDITEDTFIGIDGTHELSITGTDIKGLSVNGINHSVENLPVKVKNIAMQANVNVIGYEPSEVHISGMYQESVVIDGVVIPLAGDNSFDVELTTVENNHFINIIGKQPREYAITWNDNDSTEIYMDGVKRANGSKTLISKDVHVSTIAVPIPIHFESKDTVTIDVDGFKYRTNDFTVEVNSKTEIDVNTYTCDLTIDFGDNSYRMTLPQKIVTLTAVHRDGWIFDGWSSNNLGINNPKSVVTTVDLEGKSTGHLVCHYQRYPTINKPNMWN